MADVTNPSPKFQLIEDRLGTDLARLIRERRKGNSPSYEAIARDLWVATGVSVTAQTIANWDAALSPAEPAEGAA